MRGVKMDLTGQRFGKLLVLGESEERKRGYTIWLVKCDCGVETAFTTNSLCRKSKPTRSCGCLWKKPLGQSACNVVWKDYRRNALKRQITWGLTRDQFVSLLQQTCHYCGGIPSSTKQDKELNGPYTYNGIDRKDNTKGYAIGNVVPCCRTCNWAKGTKTYEEFMAYVQQLVHYHTEKGTFSPIDRKALAATENR